jgi:receptor-type tyrosine-protein phosphatase delta
MRFKFSRPFKISILSILINILHSRPPISLEVTEITPTSVRLSWGYSGRASEVQYYVIQYKPKMASWDYKEISGAITQFYDIRGLTPYTEYEFVVLGVNNVGRGRKSDPVVIITGETNGNGDRDQSSKY